MTDTVYVAYETSGRDKYEYDTALIGVYKERKDACKAMRPGKSFLTTMIRRVWRKSSASFLILKLVLQNACPKNYLYVNSWMMSVILNKNQNF